MRTDFFKFKLGVNYSLSLKRPAISAGCHISYCASFIVFSFGVIILLDGYTSLLAFNDR